MSSNGKRRAIAELSIDSRTLYDRLQRANIDEVVPYQELTALIGRDVRGTARGNLNTAIRMALREHMRFAAVSKIGVKRLSDSGAVDAGQSDVERGRRHYRRAMQKLSLGVADYEKLPAEKQTKFNSLMTHFTIQHFMGQAAQVKRLEAAVAGAQKQLPVGKTLELFKG